MKGCVDLTRPEVVETLARLSGEGMSIPAIARHIGVSPYALRGWLDSPEATEANKVIGAKQFESEYELVGYLWGIARDPKSPSRLGAINALLRRLEPKPAPGVQPKQRDALPDASQLTPEECRERLSRPRMH